MGFNDHSFSSGEDLPPEAGNFDETLSIPMTIGSRAHRKNSRGDLAFAPTGLLRDYICKQRWHADSEEHAAYGVGRGATHLPEIGAERSTQRRSVAGILGTRGDVFWRKQHPLR